MRSLLTMLALMTFAAGPAACGGPGRSPASGRRASTSTVPSYSNHNGDRDNDGDRNDDDEGVLDFGHAANVADRHGTEALVTDYFAAAAAEDGARGCAQLAPFIAETVAEEDGHSADLTGKTCPVVLSKLFKLHHALLAVKQATLKIVAVRVEGNRALAVLDFPRIPEVRQMTARRIEGTWKLLVLLDGILE